MTEHTADRSGTSSVDRACPCGRGASYAACCQPLHAGAASPTAERLMRSRYAAFALGLAPYLLATWHASTRPETLDLDPEVDWKRLLVESVDAGGPFDASGTVTFTAIARTPAGRYAQRERSRFVREGGRWYYVDGDALEA